jgi:CHAD domain-containing protein
LEKGKPRQRKGHRQSTEDAAARLGTEEAVRSVDGLQSGDSESSAAGQVQAWTKANPLILQGSSTAEDALAEAVRNFLDHCRGNETCVVARAHDEGVHQMRVAVRRLRSRIELFAGMVPKQQRRHADGELKWLLGELGPARDWDVFCHQILRPVLRGVNAEPDLELLRSESEGRRDRAYTRAVAALCSGRYAEMMDWLSAWAEERGWWEQAEPAGASSRLLLPAIEVAAHLLARHHRRVLDRGKNLGELTAEERHKVRIAGKRLRYTAEFFAPLYRPFDVGVFLDRLRTLQDVLGAANDLEVARRLMAEAAAGSRPGRRMRLAYASGIVTGFHSNAGDARGEVAGAWRGFREVQPFWS